MTPEPMEKLRSVSSLPDCFDGIYERIADHWEARAGEILSDDFIARTLEACYALKPWTDAILHAARLIRRDRTLSLLICLLEGWIADGGNLYDAAYAPPVGDGPAYDFLHLFPAIPTMPASVAHMRRRNVPEDVIAATMGEYDYCVELCMDRLGRPAFDRGRLSWMTCLIRGSLIRIGRLKYDLPGRFMTGVRVYQNGAGDFMVLADGLRIHRSGRILGSAGCADEDGSFLAVITEDETTVTGHPAEGGFVRSKPTELSKKEWRLCLSPEDSLARIHIPPGNGFDPETVSHSYRQAREIFDTCYPDYPYRGFFCASWLMSTDLQRILKPASNILAFQKHFIQIPYQSSGKLVFSFVFGLNSGIPEDIAALPEATSLQRAIKQTYLNGGYIHEGAGFFI